MVSEAGDDGGRVSKSWSIGREVEGGGGGAVRVEVNVEETVDEEGEVVRGGSSMTRDCRSCLGSR